MFPPAATTVFSALLCVSSFLAHADVPVHCVQPDIPGLWRFHIGRFRSEQGGWDANCGFAVPDTPDGHRHLTPPYSPSKPANGGYHLSSAFEKSFAVDMLMKDWTSQAVSVSSDGQRIPEAFRALPRGEWTMVNDEGFHVNLADAAGSQHSFFAFSKFMLGPGNSSESDDYVANHKNSYCGMTLLGWYKEIDAATGVVKQGECFWGERLKPLHEVAASNFAVPPLAPLLGQRKPPLLADAAEVKKSAPHSAAQAKPFIARPGADIAAASLSPLAAHGSTQASAGAGQKAGSVVSLRSPRAFAMCLAIIMASAAAAGLVRSLVVGNTDSEKHGKSHDTCESKDNDRYKVALSIVAAAVVIAIVVWIYKPYQLLTVSAPLPEPSKTPAAPLRGRSGSNIRDAATRMHAGLQNASRSGGVVHWQASPEKLAKWVRERQSMHGMNIHEHSKVQALLDTISPPLAVGLRGFSTQQNLIIDPARAVAVKEQKELARRLGKTPSELGVEDLRAHWKTNSTNHHRQRRFTMDGELLAEDGWQNLKDFDWRKVSTEVGGESISNFVSAVPDQGPCGSCYAFAATSMFTSRLMLRYPELHRQFAAGRGADRVSAQQQVYCNSYNQGCSGGYPYLIAKWSFENELYSEECVRQNTDSDKTCPRDPEGSGMEGPACGHSFRVNYWRYVGGAFGRCGMHHLCEQAIREEIFKGGPLAASMDVPPDMLMYSGGVFHTYPGFEDHSLEKEVHTQKDTENCKDTECFIWRKVGHSVLLVGWGEETSKGLTCQARVHVSAETVTSADPGCEKIESSTACEANPACIWRGFPYWIVQNSWGKSFGENGFIRLGPRGQNPRWIETFPMAADMALVRTPHDGQSTSKGLKLARRASHRSVQQH